MSETAADDHGRDGARIRRAWASLVPALALGLALGLAITGCVTNLGEAPRSLVPFYCELDPRLAGTWKSTRVSLFGPASMRFTFGCDCKYRVQVGVLTRRIRESGSFWVRDGTLHLTRANGEVTEWPFRFEGDRLLLEEHPGEDHAYRLTSPLRCPEPPEAPGGEPTAAVATGEPYAADDDEPAVCGPQSPRDLAVAGGTNRLPVPGDGTRPPRLCNVHFHRPAEHAGIAECPAVASEGGGGAAAGVCGSGEHRPVRAGEEIEAHWVYTSCPEPPEPRPGLDNCVCGSQEGPDPMVLMVLGRAYLVSPDGTSGAADRLAEPAGVLARYGGSTTGPSYSGGGPDDPRPCSPARVQWAMDRRCLALQVSALGEWCRTNPWNEDHAHGLRDVIEREDWLSPYTP